MACLSYLEQPCLSENQLAGCIPEGLRDVAFNDFDAVSLLFYDVLLSSLTVRDC